MLTHSYTITQVIWDGSELFKPPQAFKYKRTTDDDVLFETRSQKLGAKYGGATVGRVGGGGGGGTVGSGDGFVDVALGWRARRPTPILACKSRYLSLFGGVQTVSTRTYCPILYTIHTKTYEHNCSFGQNWTFHILPAQTKFRSAASLSSGYVTYTHNSQLRS